MDLVTLRSRPCCSHRFRSGPVRFLGASPLGAPTTSSPTTRHLPHPHRPIEFFANNFFDCRHRGSLAASTQVNHAPRVQQPPSIFSTYAPRLERVLLTRGEEGLHYEILGHIPNASSGSRSSHRDRVLPTHLPRFRVRCARSSPSSLLALERSFLPAHHSRFQFRIMARYLRLLRQALLSTSLFVRGTVVYGGERASFVGGGFSLPPPFSCHFRPPAIIKPTFCVSWRHRPAALASVLRCSSSRPLREVTRQALQLYGPP